MEIASSLWFLSMYYTSYNKFIILGNNMSDEQKAMSDSILYSG